MISRTSTPASAGAPAARAPPARSRLGRHQAISSPVSSTKTSSRFAGAALARRAPVRRRRRPQHRDRRAGAPRAQALRAPSRPRPRPAAPAGRRPRPPRRPRARRRASAGEPTATAWPCDMIVTVSAEALGLLDVVRRHQDRGALAAQPVDQRPQLLAHLRVQADGRLVEQHEPRAVDQRAGDQQPPAHAARELVDPRVAAVARGWRCRAPARSPRGARRAGRGRGG